MLKKVKVIISVLTMTFYLTCLDAQSCSTLCGPMECSLPVSSACGILRQEYCGGVIVIFYFSGLEN